MIKKILKKTPGYNLYKSIFFELKWLIFSFIPLEQNNVKTKNVLIIPAGNLNGGFGEDLMVKTVVQKFKDYHVIGIFTGDVIERHDYLSNFNNLKYIGGFKQGRYIYYKKVLKNFSDVVLIGADVLDGYHGLYNSLDRLRLLLIAAQMSINIHITGFSVNDNLPKKIQKIFKQISGYTIFRLRDVDSFNRLSKLVGTDKIKQTADIAFLSEVETEFFHTEKYLLYKKWVDDCKSQNKKIVAICPNAILADKKGVSFHLNIFETVINFLLNKHDRYAFVFLYHDLRLQCKNMNDRDLSKILFDKYKDIANCYFNPDIRNGIELKSYLHEIDFCVSARMHFGISALTYGHLMLGIEYQGKYTGLYRLCNIDPKDCIVNSENPVNLVETLSAFLSKKNEYEKILRSNIELVVQLAKKNFD